MPAILPANTTLEFFDGFDDYSTAQATRYWNSFGFSIGAVGRNGTNGFSSGNNTSCAITLTSQATRTIGVAMKHDGFTQYDFIGLYDAGTQQLAVRLNTDGTLSVKNGAGTVLATSTFSININIYYYLELTSVINNTTGSFTLRVNGTTWASASGVNTRASANNSANQVVLIAGGGSHWTGDDLYSRSDGTFCGDVRVETSLPNANGAANQWTQGGTTHANNYQQVSENPADDDTTYVFAATTGQSELYAYPALPSGSGTVYGVMAVMICRNDSAGPVTLQPLYRSAGTTYNGNSRTVGATTYAAYMDIQGQDPATSLAWTVSGVNALQVGVERV